MSRIDLDQAIDQVARQLTHVEDDAAFAERIVSTLPARTTWCGWLIGSWTPRLALIVLVAGAGLFVNRRPEAVAPIPGSPVARAFPLASPVTAVNPEPLRTKPLDRLEAVEQVSEMGDHEFSLPSLGAVADLSMKALSPEVLPEKAALSVAPLTVEPLALDPVER